MYLDKIYEGEGLGADIMEKYLSKEERFDIVPKFTLESISIASMDKLPEFLSCVWVLEKIYKQLERLFSMGPAFRHSSVPYAELTDDFDIADFLSLFSKGETRKIFKEHFRYQELLEQYAKLENALDRIETGEKTVLLISEPTISVEDFLSGEYTVLSLKKNNIDAIKSLISFRDNDATLKKNAKKVIVTSSTIFQAKEW